MNRDGIFANWRDGSEVSYRATYGDLVRGIAFVWTNPTLGKTYYRVRMTHSEVWASTGWMLGMGPHDLICGACRGDFRSTDPNDAICGTCLKEQRKNDPADRDAFTNLNGVGPKPRSFAPGRR